MSIYTTLRLPFLALTGFLILSSFIAGCNSGKEGKQLTKENGGEGTKLSAFHPILDAQVHEDDSLFLMSCSLSWMSHAQALRWGSAEISQESSSCSGCART